LTSRRHARARHAFLIRRLGVALDLAQRGVSAEFSPGEHARIGHRHPSLP